ncbi:hypothetical protein PTKIN_Ptkin13bG0135800 [Pterospermum kingtungense]
MALAATFSASSPSHHHKIFNSNSLQPLIFSSRFLFHRHSSTVRLRSNSKSKSNTHPPRRLSAGPGPPSSPDSDTPRPPGEASRTQDRVQIFFAVLFWMSLFFWASAWDGRNSGRPNKGSGFRK